MRWLSVFPALAAVIIVVGFLYEESLTFRGWALAVWRSLRGGNHWGDPWPMPREDEERP